MFVEEYFFVCVQIVERTKTPVCKDFFDNEQLCTQVRLLRKYWELGQWYVHIDVKQIKEGLKVFVPTLCPFFLPLNSIGGNGG